MRARAKVALVHDYLNQRGGAERVFAHIAAMWPDAPVFTALYDERVTGDLVPRERIHVSGLDALPGAHRYFRFLAPFYPRAFEGFDLSGYDTVVSSTSSWAKGVRVPPGAVHVCYIHTVSRFVFDYERYVGGFGVGALARPLIGPLVRWDRRAAALPDVYVANSRVVAERVRAYYGREAEVLHPPVDIEAFSVGGGGGDYFFIASRLLPYKRIDLAIEAARVAGVPLLVAGTGPAEAALRERANGSTTTLLGYVDDAQRNALMGRARAVILPGEEDFGLVPVEAAAAGRPTIAFRGGGALETVVDGRTGTFFDAPVAASLAAVLRSFDERRFDPSALREHAETFAPQRFADALGAIVERARAQR